MPRKILALCLALSLALAFPVPLLAAPIAPDDVAAEASLSVSAQSAVLIDAASGRVLFEKDAHQRLGMASTTKIMTALVVAESCDLSQTVRIPKAAVGVEGSSVYLVEGEELTVEQLLYALLLSSANDAAVALALTVADSVEEFANRMNRCARELGLQDTHFVNPNGLYDEDHYTTAYDLAIISAHALQNPTIRQIVSTYKKTIPLCGKEGTRVLVNHNKLLRLYDGAIGVKTGFTKKTGRTLVSAAEREGLRLVAVTLNAPDDWNDHTRMLDYGFSHYERLTVSDIGAYTYALPVTDGEKETVLLANTQALTLLLPKEHGEVTFRVEVWHRFEFAPVPAGTVLGRVTCECDGAQAESLLVAAENVEKREPVKKGFFARIFG